VVVVSVSHSCAFVTKHFLFQNSINFIEVTFLSSSEFWSYFLIGDLSLYKSHSLAIQFIIVRPRVSTPMPFSALTFFSLLEKGFYLWVFVFSLLVNVYFVLW
jgi:hypothetical protein